MPAQPPKPRLFALLVAINAYPAPVPPLRGCVNDLEKVAAYLRRESAHFDVSVKELVNEAATKSAIVAQFRNHLGQAAGGDVAFFYYSGHGTQEDADPVFWPTEEDRKLEALVCFDSNATQDGQAKWKFLADKEIRYLIHHVAQPGPHVLTIFDCCHAGGNTRNAYVAQQADQVRERRYINRNRLSQAFAARDWQDFIFSDVLSYEEARKQPLDQWLPEGKQIHLAACQNDQSAFETNGEGVFTRNLLEVLTRSEGEITYYDLQSRIQNYLKNQFDQTPKVYIFGDEESGLFEGFLRKKVTGKPLYGNINRNADLGWIMDLGALHGLSTQSPALRVRTLDEKNDFAAEIKEVYPTYSQIGFQGREEEKMDARASYKGYVTQYFSAPIGIYLAVAEPAIRENLLRLLSAGNADLHLTQAAYEADYSVQFTDNQFLITRPGTPAVPLVQPRHCAGEADLTIVKNYLDHLSRFGFVKNLHNPNAFLFRKDPVEVRIFGRSSGQPEALIPVRNGELWLEDVPATSQASGGSIRIVLRNTTDRKLYCALLYLTFNFGVSTKLLREVVVGLEPNREVWALDGAPISLSLEEEIFRYNYRESTSYLKLVVSTTDFKQQATRFEMPSLPGPLATGTRGLDLDGAGKDGNPGNIEDWTTRQIAVKIKNPRYQPPSTAPVS